MKAFFIAILFFASGFCIAQKECTGTIASYNGKTLVVTVAGDALLPAKNDSVKVSKDISGTSSPFGFKMTIQNGWMGIGEGFVAKSEKVKLTLTITKETTTIVENGKKKPQFVPGKKVKIEWK